MTAPEFREVLADYLAQTLGADETSRSVSRPAWLSLADAVLATFAELLGSEEVREVVSDSFGAIHDGLCESEYYSPCGCNDRACRVALAAVREHIGVRA